MRTVYSFQLLSKLGLVFLEVVLNVRFPLNSYLFKNQALTIAVDSYVLIFRSSILSY